MAWSPEARRAAIIARRRKSRFAPKKRLTASQARARRSRIKKKIAIGGAVAVGVGVVYSGAAVGHVKYQNNKYDKKYGRQTHKPGKSPYEKTARKYAKSQSKAAKTRYQANKSQSLKARKRNLAAHGMSMSGQMKRSRKPVKVTSHRLPGQAMIGSKK